MQKNKLFCIFIYKIFVSSQHEVISGTEAKEYKTRLLSNLPKLRKNAVILVDAFDLPDSSLCKFSFSLKNTRELWSSLGMLLF
jgi:hypothetical protein